jgi:hypothetical protein
MFPEGKETRGGPKTPFLPSQLPYNKYDETK